MSTPDTKKPELVDKLVADRIRAYRRGRGLSQVDVARQLGITFQQFQKYEHGLNRIGAGRLYRLAEIFQVPVQALYPESEDAIARAEYRSGDGKQIADFALSADGWRLCRAFLAITDAERRKTIIALVRVLAEDQ